MMKPQKIFFFSLPILFALLVGLSFSAQASDSPQIGQFQTPTPGPDGRIIYTVREGDNCQRIWLLHNIDENQLRGLNPELDENCTVVIGQKIMIGVGGPAAAPTITPGPSPIPTEALPTPTPFNGTTEICVLLFEDVNGNALREELELGLAGGAISVTNSLGGYSKTENSISEIDLDTLEPAYICFGEIPEGLEEVPENEKLPEGKYTVSAAIPDGYNPTNTLSYTIDTQAGERVFVNFGAQSQVSTLAEPEAEGDSSGLLGILGVFLLLGGGGLAWYAMRMQKPSSGMKYR
ncbi:MAG: LysM peptidoglycan-binding domain-containing protein [Anaerolineae bacterium]|jgi:hypothetical protein|nr:LysM peptidoglycan-binding domain-containing protein [Anaerolineae bacterium]MBT7069851.1 LysM peptidoglycan-binding domain-containing protein [Anaerolineae bacterium]MBT7324690.1 LysM peptidoglycan-binding domain-containing protein [Anaerolineae bacterium]